MNSFDRLQRWRLVLGKKAEDEVIELSIQAMEMDAALTALYDSGAKGGLGNSSPKINRWLGDIRKYFPSQVVQIMQKDALVNLGLNQMLLEPELLENIDIDVHLVGTLLSLNNIIPSKTRQTAKFVVRKVVEDLKKLLEQPLRIAIRGALKQDVPNRRPKFNEINWPKTIRNNLKHYQPEFKTIIPHELIGYGRKGQALKEIILCVDQSGSMASSIVYSSIFASVLASITSLKTHMIVFDTSVVDLTKEMDDPVDLLFGTQLGGGTDIHRVLCYADSLINKPLDTIFILISDLYEGGDTESMLKQAAIIKKKGVNFISLLALNDEGAPVYDKNVASKLSALKIPVFACTPHLFPDMMAAALKREDMHNWLSRKNVVKR